LCAIDAKRYRVDIPAEGDKYRHMASPLSAARYESPLGDRHGRNSIFVELAAEGRRILEFGCATGFISRHLAERGCHVTGVEIDAAAAEQARQWCEKVLVADLNKTGWASQVGRGFDTILFGDVLEHLVHPESALREASEVLSPNGRVIICLPNIAHWRVRTGLLMGRFDYSSTGILDVTHMRFFTLKTARALIENAGYHLVSTHLIVGGAALSRAIRQLFPRLFATQMIFVAQKLSPAKLNHFPPS
jgi:2-polyprenyl-3-methyl-5-hydroxy-6-metoxy-1,4-benzoquinol methylase